MRTFASVVLAAAISAAAFAESAPRKAPELTINETSGKQIQLSQFAKGKVCVLTFILTTCPHCQHESQMLTKLYREMGPRGLVMVGAAVDASNAAILVPQFVQEYGVAYPIGFVNADAMKNFMGFSEMVRWMVPQVVVIDRKGMIRAESPYSGDPNLQSETYMRTLLDGLLKEGATTSKSGKTTASNHHQ